MAMKAAGEAKADGLLSPTECEAALKDPKTLLVDLRDAGDRSSWVEGSAAASLGTIGFKADTAMEGAKDPTIADRPKSDPIITTCSLGGQAAVGAGILKDFGFENVKIMEGGMEAWTKAGLPVVQPDATPSGAKWGAFSLVGKTAVVTGGASGIGCAIATLFASKGAEVFIVDSADQAKSDEVATTINLTADFGGKCLAIGGCDVVQLDQVAAAFAQVAKVAGKLDILVNNAGVGHVGTDETTTDEDMDRMYNVNVKGVFHATQCAVKAMKANKVMGGSIINMCSIASVFGIKDRFAYSMSKGAALTMTYSTATDHMRDNIRCNGISPTRVHTAFVEGYLNKSYPGDPEGKAAKFKELSEYTPIGRMAVPKDIAAMALYLAADESAMCTGQNYSVDGGVQNCFDKQYGR